METAIWVLSIVFGLLFLENWHLRRKQSSQVAENEEKKVEEKLTALSIERLKIRNNVDRIPLDELVSRKRDGDGDNT